MAAGGKALPAVLTSERVTALGGEGLRLAIESGVHVRAGSTMPAWGPHLGSQWIGRIADYVLALPGMGDAEREAIEGYMASPPGTPSNGRSVYVLYCSGCHGPQGEGDGFFAPGLADSLKPVPLDAGAISSLDDAELLAGTDTNN